MVHIPFETLAWKREVSTHQGHQGSESPVLRGEQEKNMQELYEREPERPVGGSDPRVLGMAGESAA